MTKNVPASASVAIAGEALQGWNKLEEKLASKLSQLTTLLHHFSAFPPEPADGSEDEIAGQHESEIHEILNETASRIRLFKTSLEIQIQNNLVQETIEAMSGQYETLRKASEIELNGAKSRAEQLETEMKELENCMKDKTESYVRDLTLLQNHLLTRTQEFDSAEQKYISGIDHMRKDHESKMLGQREKAQKELLELAQQLSRVQGRVSELQELAKMKLEEDTQALEETKAIHKAELERLKLESSRKLKKLSQDSAFREAEWHALDVEYQVKLAEAAKEMMHSTLSCKIQVEEATLLYEASKQALTKEKEMTGELQIALCQAEEENRTLKENLTSALSKKDNLSIAFETLKKEALDAQDSQRSAILEGESKENRLKADLEIMTDACMASENDIEKYKVKVGELGFQLVANRKEVNLMVMEIDQLKRKLQMSKLEVAAKEEERRKNEGEAQLKVRTLTADISRLQLEYISQDEESSRKMTEIFEAREQQQIKAHEQIVQKLQESFMSQLEENKKGSELQLELMEEKLLRQKDEKTRAKQACAEFTEALRVVEHKIQDQESKVMLYFRAYEEKIVELVKKLEMLESTGPALEDDFNSLLKKVLKHTHQSKQVCIDFQETKATYVTLEKKLTALTQEYGATSMKYIEEIELLKQTLSEEGRAHKLALATASQSYASQFQQCMGDMQRLKEGHCSALGQLKREHQMETDALKSKIQAQKIPQHNEGNKSDNARGYTRSQSPRVEVSLSGRQRISFHQTKQEKSGEELERCKNTSIEAIKATQVVSENLTHELHNVKKSHLMKIHEIHESFQLQLSSRENDWKRKVETVEEQWKRRLENEQLLSREHFQRDIDELRHSLETSFTEERIKLETKWKKEIFELQARMSEQSILITQKDERIQGFLHRIQEMDESNRIALVDMKTRTEQMINNLMEVQQVELKKLQEEGSAAVEELQTKHRSELQATQRFAKKEHLKLEDVKHELEEKLEHLQKLFDSRESRQEDVICIMKLQESCLQKDSAIQQFHEKTSQLKLELVNREDTYNRIFGSSPTVQQGISDWLRPRAKTDVVKVDNVRLKVALETSKAETVKLQKRAASARRMHMKGLDSTIRSASDQL